MDEVSRELEIVNGRGLHARASAKFVKCAEQFAADVSVSRDGQTVPGTSIMGLMMLGAAQGTLIVVTAKGAEAAGAIDAIAALVADKFGEEA
jgi:phosphocarrier protein HPr